MDDLPSGLTSKTTYAALSPSDLKSLGKTASLAYLRKGISLNDAVIKLAEAYPSISPHQVKRIAEFANQETFGALFEDGDKYANDKNVEFDVADPGKILLELESGSQPVAMAVEPEDYACGPIKTAHRDALADVALCRVFGVEPSTPVLEKTARTLDPEIAQHAGALSRILGFEKEAEDVKVHLTDKPGYPEELDRPQVLTAGARGAIGGAGLGGLTGLALARDDIRELSNMYRSGARPLPPGAAVARNAILRKGLLGLGTGALLGGAAGALAGLGRDKATGRTYRLQDLTRRSRMQKTANFMVPGGEVAPTATQGSSEEDHHTKMLEVQREIELAKKRQELMKVQQQTDQMAMPGMEQGGAAPAGPPPDQMPQAQMLPDQMAVAPQGGGAELPMQEAPPEEPMPEAAAPAMVPPGSEMPKMSALLNEAIRYVKGDRPKTASVISDLEKATSLERIKEAVSTREDYPNADPFHDLYVAKTKVAAVVDELSRKRDLNTHLYKEAKDALAYHVEQHLWEGGNLGEVAHLMASVGSAPGVKQAMAKIIPILVRRGLSLPAAQAELARYEMEKKGSVRVPNTDHPIAQSYAAMCKLAREQAVLVRALSSAEPKLVELQDAVKEASLSGLALRAATAPVKVVGRTALKHPGAALGAGMVGMGAHAAAEDGRAAASSLRTAPWRVQ